VPQFPVTGCCPEHWGNPEQTEFSESVQSSNAAAPATVRETDIWLLRINMNISGFEETP